MPGGLNFGISVKFQPEDGQVRWLLRKHKLESILSKVIDHFIDVKLQKRQRNRLENNARLSQTDE